VAPCTSLAREGCRAERTVIMSQNQKFDGQLEIDHERGVIYFHSGKTGQTLLRISRLPKIPHIWLNTGAGFKDSEMLDITHGYPTVSWESHKEEVTGG